MCSVSFCTFYNVGTSPYTNLPRHFNVMEVLGHFADDVQLFPDSKKSYPAVLPPALHHNGLGRNRTLYYLMPKYVLHKIITCLVLCNILVIRMRSYGLRHLVDDKSAASVN